MENKKDYNEENDLRIVESLKSTAKETQEAQDRLDTNKSQGSK